MMLIHNAVVSHQADNVCTHLTTCVRYLVEDDAGDHVVSRH